MKNRADGFTLVDLVSYERKHNEANGEDNNDGANDNHSRNWGVEGPSDDPGVKTIRERSMRNFLATLIFSQGVPMIAEGTEFMHSNQGAHNSYNQPEVNQLDWDQAAKHQDLTDSVGKLIALRKRLPHFKYRRALADGRDIEWLYANGNDDPSALGFLLRPPPGERAPAGFGEVVVLANGSGEGRNFAVPPGRWRVIADGVAYALGEVDQRG